MEVADLRDLEPVHSRTIVINVHTDLVTTRAILSAFAHAPGPLLLIDCDPDTAGRAHFRTLSEHLGFEVVEAPLKLHGETLDRLFRTLADDRLLLLDSDAELRSTEFVRWMHRQLDRDATFGAGFTQGPNRIPDHWSPPAGFVLRAERPWMPCALLSTEAVRRALDAGRSFVPRYVPNEIGFSPRASGFLAARWGPPWAPESRRFAALPRQLRALMRDRPLSGLRWARHRYYNTLRPSMVFYDTGADVHEYLRYECGLLFAGAPVETIEDEVHHYSGVSRVAIAGPVVDDVSQEEIHDEVIERLRSAYDYRWTGHASVRPHPAP